MEKGKEEKSLSGGDNLSTGGHQEQQIPMIEKKAEDRPLWFEA